MVPAAGGPGGVELVFDIVVWLVAVVLVAGGLIRVWRRRGSVRRGPERSATVGALQSPPAAPEPGTGAIDTPRAHVSGGLEARSPDSERDVVYSERPAVVDPGRPPAFAGSRYSPAVLEPLARYVDHSRRLAVTEARVAGVLESLPADRWLVERYVLRAGCRIPFLVLGETGVFAIWTIPGPPPWHEPAVLARVAGRVKELLPGYRRSGAGWHLPGPGVRR